MLRCQFCYRESFLILNTCAKCDPALHKSHKAALESVVDWDTVTPEMVNDYQMLRNRKSAQQSVHPTLLCRSPRLAEREIEEMNEEILFCINHNGELLWKVSKEEVAEMRRNLSLAEELLREGVENENNMDFSWHDYFVKVRAFLSRPLDAGA